MLINLLGLIQHFLNNSFLHALRTQLLMQYNIKVTSTILWMGTVPIFCYRYHPFKR